LEPLKEVAGTKLKSTTYQGLDNQDEDEKKKLEEVQAEFEPLSKLMKEVLGDKVGKVMVSGRMADSPCMLTTSADGGSTNMARIMMTQALTDNSMTSYMESGMTMEVNPKHSIITGLKKKAAADKSDKTVKDLIWLLFDTSLLTSGFNLDELTRVAGRIHRLIKVGMSCHGDHDGLDTVDDPPSLRPPTGRASHGGRLVVRGYARERLAHCAANHACEVEYGMPLAQVVATKLHKELEQVSMTGGLGALRPAGETQATIKYLQKADGTIQPQELHSIAFLTQPETGISPGWREVRQLALLVVEEALSKILLENGEAATSLLFEGTRLHIGPTSRERCCAEPIGR